MGLRIGVAGTGRLGREHVRVLAGLDGVSFVGCYDLDAGRAREVAGANGATAFDSLEAMLDEVEAVSIVVPTVHHREVALAAVERDCDVFVEKPIAASVAEAEEMIDAAGAKGRVLQVGHVERFNSAIEAVVDHIRDPAFIEVHRLAPFSLRGTDVSVVGDLMIHDLDLLGYLLREWPDDIRAKGASILTPAPDIVNVRLEYPSGCVANVTASRVTLSPMRKIRVFCADSYVSIDMLKRSASRYRRREGFDERVARLRARPDGPASTMGLADFIEIETISPDGVEPLHKELAAFVTSVQTRGAPRVTGGDGLRAVRLATAILDQIQRQSN
jgi:predicted dehydrogenase